jgi:hypothetical protein
LRGIPCESSCVVSTCMNCGRELSYNDIGAHKKFINRASKEFLCRSCLARELDVPPKLIDAKIEQFKQQGCTLFI